jgi:hypothetical protein
VAGQQFILIATRARQRGKLRFTPSRSTSLGMTAKFLPSSLAWYTADPTWYIADPTWYTADPTWCIADPTWCAADPTRWTTGPTLLEHKLTRGVYFRDALISN